jgi:hypothetical protein
LFALAPGATLASGLGAAAINHWKAMDICEKRAQAASPDFSSDANAKREALLKECLARQNLPPRNPLSPG